MEDVKDKVLKLKQERGERGAFSVPIDSERSSFEVEDRKIKGYAIIWGSKNDFNEIVLKGACTRSIEARGPESDGKNPVVFLYQHRRAEPIAVITKLAEDDTGLYFEAEVVEGVRAADEALAMIRQGLLKQLSYGFNYIWDKVEWDENEEAYILREIKLWEISLVTFSSDENAQLRSFNDFQRNQRLKTFTPDDIVNLRALLDTFSEPGATTSQEEQETDKNKPNFF